MTLQPELRIPLSDLVALVPLDTAGAAAGVHVDEAVRRVENGTWPWCFDLAAGRREIREIRIWRQCLIDPGTAGIAEPQQVVADCIGTNNGDVRGAAIETRWRISDRTLRRLLDRGEITGRLNGHTLWIHRSSLAEFLIRRRVR